MKLYNIITALTSCHVFRNDERYHEVCDALKHNINTTEAGVILMEAFPILGELRKRFFDERVSTQYYYTLSPSLERAFCDLYQVPSLNSEVPSPFPPPQKVGFDRIKFIKW